ncbi:MAG: hypothetical protein J5548_08795 [Prevotella sp.]|nr:hypothetical protein [Prevotella sp.]
MKQEKQNESEKQDGIVSNETNEAIENNSGYYVNIDGEDVKVDIKSDEEYSCLLNCLEGYYLYGNGRDEDCEDDCE